LKALSFKEKFLGYRFAIHDALNGSQKACVRYTASQGDFSLDVSEWYYEKDGLIEEIIDHDHIGEIRQERKLSNGKPTTSKGFGSEDG